MPLKDSNWQVTLKWQTRGHVSITVLSRIHISCRNDHMTIQPKSFGYFVVETAVFTTYSKCVVVSVSQLSRLHCQSYTLYCFLIQIHLGCTKTEILLATEALAFTFFLYSISLLLLHHQSLRLFHLCCLFLFRFSIPPSHSPLPLPLSVWSCSSVWSKHSALEFFPPSVRSKETGKQRPHSSLPQITSSQLAHTTRTHRLSLWQWLGKWVRQICSRAASECCHLLGLYSEPSIKGCSF